MIPKPKREIDKEYQDYIKRQPCLINLASCVGDIVCHHTVTRGAFGSDFLTIPLCAQHHHEVHFIGKYLFQKKYNIRFEEEIEKLRGNYEKRFDGVTF